MRRLEAIRLVQWYHFQDHVFPIAANCLLVGDNGSGKTTVLDAAQIALVADAGEALFNRAANEKSRRTLYGYVRWKLGSEDEARPGFVRFGRGACTSYVLLEFIDDRDLSGSFTCGVAFEANETDTEVAKLYFLAPGKSVTQIEAVTSAGNGGSGRMVQPLRDFKHWLRQTGGRYWPDAGSYREELRHRLGVLPESFHRLLVKALAFKPIGQVRQFVFEYLLDARPVDTDALQSNLEHYKRLEGEAKDAEMRIAELEEVAAEGERIESERRTAESHRYMELRAESDRAMAQSETLDTRIQEAESLLKSLKAQAESIREEIEHHRSEHDRVIRQLEGHESYRQLREIEGELLRIGRDIEEGTEADLEARELLARQQRALQELLSERARNLRRLRPNLFERDDLLGAEEAPEAVSKLQTLLASEGMLAGRDLSVWDRRLERAADRAREVRILLERELEEMKAEGQALQDEQRSLDAGRLQYPLGPAALLHLLSARLKGRREPKPLCELIEVPNSRWRDAVEGYLNTRRFDVIVAPEDYSRALGLYERHKRAYNLPGRGEVFISGVGLVDIEKILQFGPRPATRSLAEQVQTDDAYARAYCDFVMGDVVCVDDEQSLRRHKAAITDSVMVYRNHVARQTPREIFSRHYIGQAAIHRRVQEIAQRLGELHESIVAISGVHIWLKDTVRLLDQARADAGRLADLIGRASRLAALKVRAQRLREQKDRINRDDIRDLEKTRDELKNSEDRLSQEHTALVARGGGIETELKHLSGELISARAAQVAAQSVLDEFALKSGEALEGYRQRYSRERQQRTPEEIYRVFEQQRRSIETRIENSIRQLIRLKTQYVERRGLVAEIEGSGFEEFSVELAVWRDSRLPEYREKIAESKSKALQQLTEDIVFRLRENLQMVRRQIDDLNRALRDVPFGSERYQFTVEVDPEHKDFYDLVMDAGRFEKESLFGESALTAPEVKNTLEHLLDRLVESEAREVKTELEARADYREYFRYDLKILHADGGYSLYDKVSGDKSGGETQTPYYIAILASMYRLYRSRSSDGHPVCGIVLLDEAFGKMDESRISATLTYARRLGLQLVLATPKERSELVAPHVERTLLIHKEPVSGMPEVFDFTKEFTSEQPAVASEEESSIVAGTQLSEAPQAGTPVE
jgi:uncharacterized protein YPO0396